MNRIEIINNKKHCSKCNKLLSLNLFRKSKVLFCGYGGYCRECQTFSEREWYGKNAEKVKEKSRQYRLDNIEKIRTQERKIYWENREKNLLKCSKYYQKNKNKEKYKKYRREYQQQRLRKDPQFYLNHRMGNVICKTLKGNKNGYRWETLVGYTSKDLMAHLENQFTPEMSWQNHGSYWHIDHIVPQSWFNYKAPEDKEFRICWDLDNLQPLEAKENISKNSRGTYKELIKYCLFMLGLENERYY